MNKIKNRSTKAKREKEIYFKARILDDALFILVQQGKLDEDELKKLREFKQLNQVIQQLGPKLAKQAELKFEYGKYFKFRKEMLEKYSEQQKVEQDETSKSN
jgi:hypothetical protein